MSRGSKVGFPIGRLQSDARPVRATLSNNFGASSRERRRRVHRL